MMRLLRRRASPLEQAIGYRFRDQTLLETALMHPSYRAENAEVAADNQRLEFLGDAALGFVAGAHIYRRFADKEEGVLTVMRSRITSGRALAKVAHGLNLGEQIRMGRGEVASGGQGRGSTLADAASRPSKRSS